MEYIYIYIYIYISVDPIFQSLWFLDFKRYALSYLHSTNFEHIIQQQSLRSEAQPGRGRVMVFNATLSNILAIHYISN
jgi:hypothetical protein